MIFRVIAIKELFGENYKIDLLFFGVSEEKIRDILHEYKLVALELYEYKKEKVEPYGKIKILLEIDGQEYRTLSNATELDDLIYQLSVIGLNVKNINYVDGQKLGQPEINEILSSQKEKAEQRLKRENDIVERNKEKDSAIFDDQKLERTLKLTKEFLEKVPIFVEKAKYTLSKAELKLLEDQRQELSKLKMGNNVDKISTFLEEAYDNYTNLEQKYLSFQDSPNIDVSGSNITDAYLLAEITKLEKAKNLLKIGGGKGGEDILYANFGGVLLYLKMIKKDFLYKIKNISQNLPEIFYYLTLLFFFITVFSSVYLSIINKNEFLFVIMICSGVFGLVFFCISLVNKKSKLLTISLLFGGSIVSIVLIRLLKQFFIF